MFGCVLAVLDSHHRVSIWESTGIGITDIWVPVNPPPHVVIDELRKLMVDCEYYG